MTWADLLRDPDDGPEQRCRCRERERLIWALASCMLTKRQHRVLELRYRDEMTLDEIGRRMGIGVPAVHALHARAIQTLRHGMDILGIHHSGEI